VANEFARSQSIGLSYMGRDAGTLSGGMEGKKGRTRGGGKGEGKGKMGMGKAG